MPWGTPLVTGEFEGEEVSPCRRTLSYYQENLERSLVSSISCVSQDKFFLKPIGWGVEYFVCQHES